MQSYSDLPEEITFNILSRLPAKSIGSCRCVSNSWHALLSTPYFIRTHLEMRRNLREESLLLLDEHSSIPSYLWYVSLSDACQLFDEITVSPKRLRLAGHSKSWSQIHSSCDGLLLIENCDSHMYVLNPITTEIRKVPVSPSAAVFPESFSIYGFGYESLTDDYKIVTVYHEYNHNYDPDGTVEMFVDVYSLKTDTWKRAGSSLYHHPSCEFSEGVYVNGYIHYLIVRETDGNATIVAFDMVQEKFHEVPPPNCGFGPFASLALFGGHLCTSNIGNPDVWVMKEYGVEQSWTKFTISNPKLNGVNPIFMLGEDVLVLKDMEQFSFSWNEKLFAYNFKEEELKEIVFEGIRPELLYEASFVESFVESLVSPHC